MCVGILVDMYVCGCIDNDVCASECDCEDSGEREYVLVCDCVWVCGWEYVCVSV